MLMIVTIGADANGMVVVPDSICVEDSVSTPAPKVEKEESFFDKVYEVIKSFSRVDKKYIEPQHYNYTVMLQNTNTFESYTLSNKDGQEIVLSPEPSVKLGPYVGERRVTTISCVACIWVRTSLPMPCETCLLAGSTQASRGSTSIIS